MSLIDTYSNQREVEAAFNELQPIHMFVQKPKGYDKMNTMDQTLWAIKTLGKIGSYCDERKATLDKIEAAPQPLSPEQRGKP
jgi:hypothetical protein